MRVPMLSKEQWMIVVLAAFSGGGGTALSNVMSSNDYVTHAQLNAMHDKMNADREQRRREIDVKLDALLQQTHQMRVDTEVMKAQVVDMRDYFQQRFGWTARK